MTTAARLVGKYVELARLRESRDRASAAGGAGASGGASDRGLWFDEDAVLRVVEFFARLRHWKGEWAGVPFWLEEWQVTDIIAPLFGWKRADGSRRFRTAYIEIGRKNGKSLLAAGIGLYMLMADGEEGAEVYSAAAKKDFTNLIMLIAPATQSKVPLCIRL